MSSSPDFTPKIIACETLRDEYTQVAPGVEVEFVKGLLHDYPEKLRAELNERIAGTPGRRTILLGYGRCSNGTAGLQAGPHRLVLPESLHSDAALPVWEAAGGDGVHLLRIQRGGDL